MEPGKDLRHTLHMSQHSTSFRRLVSIPEAQAFLGGIGRTKLYELAKKDLRLVKLGRRSFFVEADLVAFVSKLTEDQKGSAGS